MPVNKFGYLHSMELLFRQCLRHLHLRSSVRTGKDYRAIGPSGWGQAWVREFVTGN